MLGELCEGMPSDHTHKRLCFANYLFKPVIMFSSLDDIPLPTHPVTWSDDGRKQQCPFIWLPAVDMQWLMKSLDDAFGEMHESKEHTSWTRDSIEL